jgi:hypothetical protein
MKRMVGQILAKHFFAFLLGFLTVGFSPEDACDNLEAYCWISFEPSVDWAHNHPGCLPEVYLDDECEPSAELLDCNAGSGNVIIGDITLYYDMAPIALYRVISEDGNVITVLIDEF